MHTISIISDIIRFILHIEPMHLLRSKQSIMKTVSRWLYYRGMEGKFEEKKWNKYSKKRKTWTNFSVCGGRRSTSAAFSGEILLFTATLSSVLLRLN